MLHKLIISSEKKYNIQRNNPDMHHLRTQLDTRLSPKEEPNYMKPLEKDCARIQMLIAILVPLVGGLPPCSVRGSS